MAWKIYGNQLDTADVDGVDKSQAMKMRLNSNLVIRSLRSWFVFYNSPAFTSLKLRLYEDQGGVAGKLIAECTNSYVPADVYTDDYALKGIHFEFNNIAIKGTNWIHCLPIITGYTGSDSSHIAWVKGFPDPEYRTGLTLNYESMHVRPYRLAVVGAPL